VKSKQPRKVKNKTWMEEIGSMNEQRKSKDDEQQAKNAG